VHDVSGHFDKHANGKPVLTIDKNGTFRDKYGIAVNQHGRRIDHGGHILNKYHRKTLDKSMLGPDGDIGELYNFNGDKYHIDSIAGYVDKD
jgi:hypothetical protein